MGFFDFLRRARSQPAPRARAMRVFLHDPDDLETIKARVGADTAESPALARLRAASKRALELAPIRCADKTSAAPSGDPRDYLSIGTYWWPNPDTSDGLPYVRRDGEINPETYNTDCGRIRKLIDAARALGYGWYYFREPRYAEHAAELTRRWFLDPEGAMNPHLRFAQCVPGVTDGRSYGIIDTCVLRHLVDALGLIADSGAWSADDEAAMRAWCSQFLDWLLTSRNGRRERDTDNNHGTWYDVQCVALALYADRMDVAHEILARAPTKRISRQIEADGSQPAEFARSRPLTYCTMNLNAMAELASLGEAAGVDLWNARTTEGGSIRDAMLWLLPYLEKEKEWPQREIVGYCPENYVSLFRRAALKYSNPRLEPENLPLDQPVVAADLMQLQYPKLS